MHRKTQSYYVILSPLLSLQAGLSNWTHAALQKFKIYMDIFNVTQSVFMPAAKHLQRLGVSYSHSEDSKWLSNDLTCGLAGQEMAFLRSVIGTLPLTFTENCCMN